MNSNIRDRIIYPLVLYVALAGLAIAFWWNISPSMSDMGVEIEYSKVVLAKGWFAPIDEFSSMSIVVRVIAPAISQTFGISVEIVYKIIFILIFSLTPVLLYYLYRKLLPANKAFLSSLFFVILPPTFMGTAGIGKTTIAEPLVVGALLVIFSSWGYIKKVIIAGLLLAFAIMCHYTIGAFFLGWLVIMICVSHSENRKLYITLLLIGIATMLTYYYFVGNWFVFTRGWESISVLNIPPRADKVYDFMYLQNVGGSSIIPQIMRGVYYLNFALIAVGIIYLIRHFQYVKQNREYFSVMFVCGIFIILALFIDRLAVVLLLDRWVQIGAIFLSVLVGLSSYWISYKIIYPLMAINTFYILCYVH